MNASEPACLGLELVQSDMPLFLIATVLAGDFVYAPFQRAAEAEIIIGYADNFIRLYRSHDPI